MRRYFAGMSAIAALILLAGAIASSAPDRASEFLWISDVHFDPTANAALVDKLTQADVSEWADILRSSPGKPSTFGQDSDWPLLASALQAIRKASPQAQFTILTGDVFVHKFRDKFNSTATKHDDASFQQFAAKTFDFLAAQFESLTPGKPVFFTAGNNDGDCGDYALQPYGPFLRSTAPIIEKMLGPVGNKASEVDWSDAGNYDVPNPSLPGTRVISLNSVFFSAKYHNACGTAGNSDPGKDQMQWLAAKLARAKSHNEKVWLVFHIPPGIDGYSTSQPKEGGERTIVPMWNPDYTAQFQDLLEQYQDTVTMNFAGHEHMDDFRLIDHSLILLAPALSPVSSQNPAFRVVDFASNGTLTNAITYYLLNLNALDSGSTAAWKPEYSFAQAWHIHALDFDSFSKLDHELETNPEIRSRWEKFYSVSHADSGGITNETFPWLFCADSNMSATSFSNCVQQLQSK